MVSNLVEPSAVPAGGSGHGGGRILLSRCRRGAGNSGLGRRHVVRAGGTFGTGHAGFRIGRAAVAATRLPADRGAAPGAASLTGERTHRAERGRSLSVDLVQAPGAFLLQQ